MSNVEKGSKKEMTNTISGDQSKLRFPSLSEVLFDYPALSFSNLAPFSFNIEALEAALVFSAGLNSFVAIVGPSGWGKTHLLSAVRTKLRGEGRDVYPILSASKLSGDHNYYTGQSPLLIDDCQEIVEQGRGRALARMVLENRVRSQKPTILTFTSDRPTRPIRSLLPHPRQWEVCTISEPESTERIELIKHLAKGDGLLLSSFLVKILANEMHGNGRTISGALKRLKISGSFWNDNFATVRACGILNAFFSDNSGWDLKHRIVKTVSDHRKHCSDRSHYSDISAYVMLKVACLSEMEVARTLGVEPAAAYFSSSRFEADLKSSTPKMVALAQLLESLVKVIAREP